MALRDSGTDCVYFSWGYHQARGIATLSIIYEVGDVSFGSLRCGETDGVSWSSKEMPPMEGLALTWPEIVMLTRKTPWVLYPKHQCEKWEMIQTSQ